MPTCVQSGRAGRARRRLFLRALPFTGDDDIINTVMAGLVAVLVLALLVVASNIASLVFARTWSRSSELAVRTDTPAARALSASCLRRAILCAIASVVGLALAQVSLRFLVGKDDRHPVLDDFELHGRRWRSSSRAFAIVWSAGCCSCSR